MKKIAFCVNDKKALAGSPERIEIEKQEELELFINIDGLELLQHYLNTFKRAHECDGDGETHYLFSLYGSFQQVG